MAKLVKLIEKSDKKDFSEALNANNLIDVKKLFNVVLGEGGSGYDDLQFFEKPNTFGFDEDDKRAELLSDVEDGGALLYDVNSDEYVIFTRGEMRDGVDSIAIGTSYFEVEVEDTIPSRTITVDKFEQTKSTYTDDILTAYSNGEIVYNEALPGDELSELEDAIDSIDDVEQALYDVYGYSYERVNVINADGNVEFSIYRSIY